MIRRGDFTDIAWVFVWLEMNCLITYQLEEVLIICHHYTHNKVFDKPLKICASIDMSIGWEVQYFE